MAAGGNGRRKFVTTIPQALRASSLYTREPFKCTAGGTVEMGDNLSVSLRLPAPLGGEP